MKPPMNVAWRPNNEEYLAMIPWLRVAVLGCAAALGGGVACGAADFVSPPYKAPCDTVYFGGGKLPPPPDGPSLCAPGLCNYQAQTGCGAGESCAPHIDTKAGTVAPGCRAAGQRARGEPCDDKSTSAAKQCGIGLQCVEGECHTMCCGGDWSACRAGESCIRQGEVKIGDTILSAGVDFCFPVGTCNVLSPDSCKTQGRVCRIADPIGEVACMPPSDLVQGDPCDHEHQCGPLLHCVGSADPGAAAVPFKCRKLCPWGVCGAAGCGAGEGVCVHFNRDPRGVGECTPDFHGKPVFVDGGIVADAGLLFADAGFLPVSDASLPVPDASLPVPDGGP